MLPARRSLTFLSHNSVAISTFTLHPQMIGSIGPFGSPTRYTHRPHTRTPLSHRPHNEATRQVTTRGIGDHAYLSDGEYDAIPTHHHTPHTTQSIEPDCGVGVGLAHADAERLMGIARLPISQFTDTVRMLAADSLLSEFVDALVEVGAPLPMGHWAAILEGASTQGAAHSLTARMLASLPQNPSARGDIAGLNCLLTAIWTVGVHLDVTDHTVILRATVNRKRTWETRLCALAVRRHLEQTGLPPSAEFLGTLAIAHSHAGDVAGATAVVDEILSQGMCQNTVMFNTLMCVCANGGDMTGAEQVYREMCSLGLTPTLRTYTILVKGYAQLGQTEAAHAVLREMHQAGVRPDAWLCGTVMSAYARTGDIGQARGLLEEMYAAELKPNVVTWTSLVATYTKARDVDGARGVLSEMKRAGVSPNVRTYHEMMTGYARAGRFRDGMSLMREMWRGQVRPDEYVWNALLNAGVRGAATTHRILGTFHAMKQHNIRPGRATLSTLLTYFRDSPTQAEEVFGEIVGEYGVRPDRYVQSALVKAVGKARAAELLLVYSSRHS